jgi:DNA polymerase III gamma/tau subunit
MQYLRDVLVTRVAPHATDLLSVPGETADLEALAGELGEEDLVRSLEVLTQAEDGLRLSPEPRFHLEMALLKIAQLRRLASFEELLARFEKLATGGGPVPSPPVPPGPATLPRKATPPPPAERASEAAPVEGNGTIDALWDRLKSGKPMLHAIVSRHHRAEVEAGRLRIQFLSEQKVLAEQLRDRSLLSLLEEQASSVFGRKLAVAVEVVENGGKPEAPEVPEIEVPAVESRVGLEERAKQDPLVKRFVETFQGEVEDVVSSDGSR